MSRSSNNRCHFSLRVAASGSPARIVGSKTDTGGPLRRLVAEQFHLKYFIDMVDTEAFISEVIAYPAVVVIAREKPGPTRIAAWPRVDAATLRDLAKATAAPKIGSNGSVSDVARAAIGAQPWMLGASDDLGLMRRLEAQFPTLEEAGCKVGIGVATGAD